jgi:hypothetical protein
MEDTASDGRETGDGGSVDPTLVTDGGRRDSDQQNDQREQSRGGQQPQQGSQPQRQGPNSGRPPSQGDSGGISRRQLLLGGGGVAVAGWFLFFRSDSEDQADTDSNSDPTGSATSVTEGYYRRVKNRNFEGARNLVHPDRSTSTDQQLEQLAETLSDITTIEAEVTNGPTPDAERSRYDTVQAFEAVSVVLEKGDEEGSNYVSGTVAHHTDGRWLVWL